MKRLWCWRCKADMPMLDEDEFAEIGAVLARPVSGVKSARETHNTFLDESPVDRILAPAREKYEELTGMAECHQNAICHHRISLYGPPCESCGKVLRTPTASKCWECGAERAPGPWMSERGVSLPQASLDPSRLSELLNGAPCVRGKAREALEDAMRIGACKTVPPDGPMPLDRVQNLFEINEKIAATEMKLVGRERIVGSGELLDALASAQTDLILIHGVEAEKSSFMVFTDLDSRTLYGVLQFLASTDSVDAEADA